MRASRILGVAVVVETVALVLLGASTGSLGGRVLKVALTLAAMVAVVWLRRGHPHAGAAAGVGFGAAGLAVGLGIGPRHLSVGLSARGALGAVAAAAGLVAVVAATTVLLRGGRRRRALLAVPIGALVLVLGLPVTIAVAAADPPPTPLGTASPADVGLAFEEVRFPAGDGTPLEGWWVPGHNGAAVVLLHGSGSNRASVLGHVATLAAGGYGVLAFDARGHGGSGGTGMDLGWHGPDDLAGALDLVAGLPGVDPDRLGAVGLSMGGEEALAGMGDPRLRAVVAEGATRRAASDDGWLPTHPGGLVQRGMDLWQDAVVAALTATAPPPSLRSVVAGARAPVLLVTAGSVPDEAAAAEWIASGAPGRVEVWTVPGAGHTDGLSTDPTAWAARVLGFLDRSLADRRAPDG